MIVRNQVGTIGLHYAAAVIIAILMAFPFYWMATSALKTNDEIWQFPPTFWPHDALWSNFRDAWSAAHLLGTCGTVSSFLYASSSFRRSIPG